LGRLGVISSTLFIVYGLTEADIIHISIDGHTPYNLLILTNDYSKTLTTMKMLPLGCMTMFVVTSILIQINGQRQSLGSINNLQGPDK